MPVERGLHGRLAQLEFEQWAEWANDLLANRTSKNVRNWKRLIEMPFEKLSKSEEHQYMLWADQVMTLLTDLGISLRVTPAITESKSANPPLGWICPNCGIAYAPWVMSCECERDAVSCPCQCGTSVEAEEVRTPCEQMLGDCQAISHDEDMRKCLGSYRLECEMGYQNSMSDYPCRSDKPTEVDDQPPLVTEADHDEFYVPDGPSSCVPDSSLAIEAVNLRAKVQFQAFQNAALLDQLTRWREVCQQACGGSEELCAAVDDRRVQVHDEAVTLQRQQDAAIAELQDAQDFVAALDATPEAKDLLSKHPFAVAQVRDALERLASTEEDSPPRTLRFEVKNMQTLEAEILQHQQDAATNPLPGYTEALQELREDGAVPSRKTDYE